MIKHKLPKTCLVTLEDVGDGPYLIAHNNNDDDIKSIDDSVVVGVYELREICVKRESHELVTKRGR